MREIIFIRHAETDMAGTFCGHSDPTVNDNGHRQIAELLQALNDEAIESVYSSDLKRAVATARAISERFHVPCILDRNLRELNFGKWEGLTWQQIQEFDGEFAQRWMEMFPNLPAPDGEGFDQFKSRVLEEIDSIFQIGEDRKVAVVTHGGVMRVVLQTMCDLDETQAWELTKSYCSFFRYPYRSTP